MPEFLQDERFQVGLVINDESTSCRQPFAAMTLSRPIRREVSAAATRILLGCLLFGTPRAFAATACPAPASIKDMVPTRPTAENYAKLGHWYADHKQFPCAADAFSSAVHLEPASASMYYFWGLSLYSAGNAGSALAPLQRAVQLDPNNVGARTDLAEFYLEAPGIVGGGQDKARAQADMVAKLNPAKAHWIQGRLAEKNKDSSTAEKEYRAAIDASHGGVATSASYSNTLELGRVLYTRYAYPLELAAMLLLVAIIAAITLTLRHRPGYKQQDVSAQVAVRPKDRLRVVKMDAEPPP